MEKNRRLEEAAEIIKNTNNIMVFSGAGLSTESGIPDFRSANGLYSKNFKGYNPETILSYTFFNNNPEIFWEYMRENFNYTDIKPGRSYELLKELQNMGKISSVVTQNIDSLHEDAGIINEIAVHGDLNRCYCDVCGRNYSYEDMMNGRSVHCDTVGCRGDIRPSIVLYEESVDKLSDVFMKINSSDMLLVLGSSLTVYPIAQLPQIFAEENKKVIIINRDITPYRNYKNTLEINMNISEALEYIVEQLKK